MSFRATRPLAALALLLLPSLAAAADVFVAASPVAADAAAGGRLLSGMQLTLVSSGIDPDEIDYDGTVEGIDPDEIDYDGTVEGIDPDEIDYDGAGRVVTIAAVEPAGTITVEGVPLTGIDPDEIDVWAKRVVGVTPLAQTREHVMLARQTGAADLTETQGHAILRLDGIAVRSEAAADGGKAFVADLTLTVVAIEGADAKAEAVELWIEGGTTLGAAR